MPTTPRLPLLFRILYTAFYTLLLLFLVVLLLITPGDAIRQALENSQLYNVFVVAGSYLLTVVLAVLIYASRLYTTRSVLSLIPKTYVPVEKGDVGDSVRRNVVESLQRSASIAFSSRPRADEGDTLVSKEGKEKNEDDEPARKEKVRRHFWGLGTKKAKHEWAADLTLLSPRHEAWALISHDGWSSPLSAELPNVEYTTVIHELPHLIEAKAVSLAPLLQVDDGEGPVRDNVSENITQPVPDPRAIDLLQRGPTDGLRDYIHQLISLGALTATDRVEDFVLAYERARFAARPLSEVEFAQLTESFAAVLRAMKTIDENVIRENYIPVDVYGHGDISGHADVFDGEWHSSRSAKSLAVSTDSASGRSMDSASLRSVIRY